jgi:hypothetical protein
MVATAKEQSHKWWDAVRRGGDQFGVGCIFILVKPHASTNYLGSGEDLPIIPHCVNCIPIINTFQQTVPNCEMQYPLPGQTRFFAQTGIEIKVTNAEGLMGTCKGCFCDRQAPTDLSLACGCFQSKVSTPGVINCDVTFPVPLTIVESGKLTVVNFKSFMFSNILCKDVSITVDQMKSTPYTDSLKPKVNAIVDYINTNGGWNLIGWVRTGVTQEAGTEEDIASFNTAPHIVHLQPSNTGQLVQLETLKITTPGVNVQGWNIGAAHDNAV